MYNIPVNTKELNSICIVAIVKNEEPFLDEWLIYHKLIGVDYFFLYDDNESLLLKEFLLPHHAYVTVVDWQQDQLNCIRQGNQIRAYKDACERLISGFEWVVFLDADEFIVIQRHETIKDFLREFDNANAISLNWHLFGHNGFYNNPERLITTSLNRRMFLPSPEVKTITRTNVINGMTSPHFCDIKSGLRVDANNNLYSDTVYDGKSATANINHYQCRSFNQWMNRIDRGNVNYNPNAIPAGHQWRFDKDLCLERFISNISRDKNEYVDNYMYKYRYDIHEMLLNIHRNKVTKGLLDFPMLSEVTKQLEYIADTINNNKSLTDIGLQHGQTGIALFYFYYARFSNNPTYNKIAKDLIENVNENISEKSAIDFNNGLAGYGFVIECLVREAFIKIDTNDILEDVDLLLHYNFTSQLKKKTWDSNQIMGIGKYYLERLRNPFNDMYHTREQANKQLLDQVISSLYVAIHEKDLLNIIDFLTDAYKYGQDKYRIKQYIEDTLKKVFTLLCDTSIEFAPMNIQPLHVSALLLKVSTAFDDYKYFDQALILVKKFNIENSTQYCVQPILSDAFLYIRLLKGFKNKVYLSHAISLLSLSLMKWTAISIDNTKLCQNDIALSEGIAGIGLGLLAAIDECELFFVCN